jgi:hypothetical protein
MPVVKSSGRTFVTAVRITLMLCRLVRFCGSAVELSSEGKDPVEGSFTKRIKGNQSPGHECRGNSRNVLCLSPPPPVSLALYI